MKPKGRTLASLVPQSIGNWRVTHESALVLPTGQTGDPLFDEQVAQTYGGTGVPEVMLLIAYLGVQTSARRIHQPTGCYPSNGFTVSNLRDARWPVMDGLTVPGRLFTAVREDRIEHVGYWQRIGEHFPVTRMDERIALVVGAFQGLLSDSLLVRMSVITTEAEAARSVIADFSTALIRSCDPVARALLIGALSSGGAQLRASAPAPHTPTSPAA